MKICKQTLKEIAINGTTISKEVKTHFAVCGSCVEAYRKEMKLENFLFSAKDFEAPENLKYAVLEAANNRQLRKSPFLTLRFTLKAVGVLIILISGFWLGLQTANNGNDENQKITNDFTIINALPYRLNTEPLFPENLSEIYFTVLEEAKNGK